MLRYFALAKILFSRKCRVDSWGFYIHYRLTFLVFVISSLIVTAREFFSPRIVCTASGVSGKILNSYCYFTGTYSIPSLMNESLARGITPGKIPYPGVGLGTKSDEQNISHSWYQWVTIALFIQGLFTYLPHYVWKSFEGGLYRTVLGGLEQFTLETDSVKKRTSELVVYIKKHMHLHRIWVIRFFCCEIANVVVALLNLYFIDHFLGGTFLTYGTDVINFPDMPVETRVDPMTRIFPKMAKCTFRKFGPSGSLEVHDAFCLLAVNIINEKIYIFIWFWLLGLIAVSLAWAVYRLVIIFSPAVRNKLLMSKGRLAGQGSLKIICDRVRLGDWFLIYQLGFHMEPIVYSDFLKDLAMEFQNTAPTLERKPMLVSN